MLRPAICILVLCFTRLADSTQQKKDTSKCYSLRPWENPDKWCQQKNCLYVEAYPTECADENTKCGQNYYVKVDSDWQSHIGDAGAMGDLPTFTTRCTKCPQDYYALGNNQDKCTLCTKGRFSLKKGTREEKVLQACGWLKVFKCKDAVDCNLLGTCHNGKCKCNTGFYGDNCIHARPTKQPTPANKHFMSTTEVTSPSSQLTSSKLKSKGLHLRINSKMAAMMDISLPPGKNGKMTGDCDHNYNEQSCALLPGCCWFASDCFSRVTRKDICALGECCLMIMAHMPS